MYKILIADDKEDMLSRLSEFLRRPDYELIKAHSGDEASARILQGGLDCIILDDHMPPGPAGSRIADETQKKDPNIPIILWSTGASDYALLFKDTNVIPFDKGDFVELKKYVNRVLPKK